MNVILTIDKVHTAVQSVLDCEPGLGGLNQVYGSNCPTSSAHILLTSLPDVLLFRDVIDIH